MLHPPEPPKTSKITLNSNRIITLTEIYQDITYSGLLEGLPTKIMNKEIISKVKAHKKLWSSTVPLIIMPVETQITVSSEKKKFYDNMGEGWDPMSLPRISCITDFESDPVDNKFMFSYLTIAWFQNDWAMPIEKRILNQIKCINWNKYAVDGDY